jgi:hypothetical protein
MDSSLTEFARTRDRGGWAWHDTLDDDLFNEIWDVMHTNTGIGEITILAWLRSKGYNDVTEGKLKGVRIAERR